MEYQTQLIEVQMTEKKAQLIEYQTDQKGHIYN